jgi:hypothetical protein
MEVLFSKNEIVTRDVQAVYEALFLRAVTSFEVFLEDQFIAIMSGHATYAHRRRVSARMTAISRQALMDILLRGERGGEQYMTWLPFSQTERRANTYLKDGKPFSELTDGDKSMIRTIATIRNAIAHRSAHATNEFRRTVIGSRSLLPSEKSPAGFLRSQARAAPIRNRFEVYVSELARMATALC